MASLYCKDDGLEMFKKLKKGQISWLLWLLRLFSKNYTKIVIGLFADRDECRCDLCNCPIRPGDTAVYVSHHNENQPDDCGERNFLNVRKAKTYKL